MTDTKTLRASAEKVVSDRDRYGWSPEADAAIEELRASLAAHAQAGRCTSCDGTGDGIDPTGEWRGYCVCQAGAALKAQAEPVRRVFIVATGETHNGEETYTRHDDAPPPLCDAECLYTAPRPAAQPVRHPLDGELVEMAEVLQAICARVIEQYSAVYAGIDFAAVGGRVNRILERVGEEHETAQAVRQPLTRDQITHGYADCNFSCAPADIWFEAGVRYAERANGIGQEGGAA